MFDPQSTMNNTLCSNFVIVEYEHARAKFVLAIVLDAVERKQEAVEYVESAQERMEALVRSITPAHVDLGSMNPLICSVISTFLVNSLFCRQN
jgi:hypothetical protein